MYVSSLAVAAAAEARLAAAVGGRVGPGLGPEGNSKRLEPICTVIMHTVIGNVLSTRDQKALCILIVMSTSLQRAHLSA
jgi:hypothetical protein